MKYLRVKDWDKYQHYKDRNPPWIKLQTDTFRNYDFSCLQDASKLLAFCIMTLASCYKDPKQGLVPCDLKWIKSQCNVGDLIQFEHLQELVNTGFLADDSNALAECLQHASLETEAEAETETEKIKEKKQVKKEKVVTLFDDFWSCYPVMVIEGKHCPKGKKQFARKSYDAIIQEGVSHDRIMEGVRKYVYYLQRTGGRNAHASTWLNERRFEKSYDTAGQYNKFSTPSLREQALLALAEDGQ